jgi:hypothetical protein
VYDRRSCDRRYSGLRWEGGWVGGNLDTGAGECLICSMGAAGVTAGAAVLALLAIWSSYWQTGNWRRTDESLNLGGIVNISDLNGD